MADAGQLWSGSFQIARESTPGLAAAATRKIYFDPDGALSTTADPRVHRFLVGRRDNVLDYTSGPEQAGGGVGQPVSADENLEMFLISLQGAVTPTTPAGATLARLWQFKASAAVDSATVEWDDGANVWIETGVKGNQMTLTGAVGDTNMLTFDLFGTGTSHGSLTGALSDRSPSFMEGWQTRFYIDAFGSAFGQTPIPGTLINWNVQVSNNDARQYRADNTKRARRVTVGELDVTSTIVFDAATLNPQTGQPFGIEQFDLWKADTKRGIRLEFLGPADGIEAGASEVQSWSVTGGPPTTGNTVVKFLGINVTVAWNQAAAALQTSLNTAVAAAHGPDNTFTVAGGPLPGAPLTVTATGSQVTSRDLPIASTVSTTLDAGAMAYTSSTPGRSGRRSVIFDIPGAWTAPNLGGNDNGVRTYEFSHQAIYDPTLAAMLAVSCQTNRTTAF